LDIIQCIIARALFYFAVLFHLNLDSLDIYRKYSMRLIQHLIQTNYQEITLYPREGRLKLLPVFHVYTRKTKRSLKEQRQVSPPIPLSSVYKLHG